LLSLFDRDDRVDRVAGIPLLWAYLLASGVTLHRRRLLA
jgi:hypothetical protein